MGRSVGKQALMTPRWASRAVRSAIRQYVVCRLWFVAAPVVDVSWTR